MTTPIDQMIDAAVRCVKCGKPRGQCRCWITLRCSGCGRQKLVERLADDPSDNEIAVTCPDCRAKEDCP